MWTLDDLVDRVRAALAAAEYSGAPNGRVRDLPDRRAVRWYATTGLVDRPVAMRGRVALYGPRHLLQLVALKRRQAEGRTLAEIQAELAGATDATLARIARVPGELLAARPPDGEAAGDGTAGDGTARTPSASPAREPAPGGAGPAVDGAGRVRPRFWAAAPVMTTPPLYIGRAAAQAGDEPEASRGGAQGERSTLAGVPLSGGVFLLLPGHPDADGLAAIEAAAAPLIDLLDDLGLLAGPPARRTTQEPPPSAPSRADRRTHTRRSSS
jgi:hypothetical protein